MLHKQDYISYLLSTQVNYTCTELADHRANLSHDALSDFLRRERFTSSQLWEAVHPHIEDDENAAAVARRSDGHFLPH